MKAAAVILLVMAILGWSAPASAQGDMVEQLAKRTRVALLPFANYAEVPKAMPDVMSLVRTELKRYNVPLADSQATADALRRHRVRNTNELTLDQIHALSDQLGVAYLLVGSLDRYVSGKTAGEVALSARLIYVPTGSIEWVSTATRHSLDGIRVLEVGREPDAERLAALAAADLFHNFGYRHADHRKEVEWVWLRNGGRSHKQLCERILVLPLGNESTVYNAGGIFYNHLIAALDRRGFTVVEPGRAREMMLEDGNMAPGRASESLLQLCGNELGTNLILTGAVSTFECALPTNMDQIPTISVEARLIEAQTGQVVWARDMHCSGSDSQLLFGVGTTYSVSTVARRLADDLVKAIPVERVRRPQ
jgi:TolB-like protein